MVNDTEIESRSKGRGKARRGNNIFMLKRILL